MKTIRFTLIFIILLSSGCATQIQHIKQGEMDQNSAVKIIEQVIMEQPAKHRPENIIVTNDYLGIGSGSVTKGKVFVTEIYNVGLGTTKHLTKNINERIYFNSIGTIKIFEKREWYIIQLFSKEGRIYKYIYSLNKRKAMKFIDAINYFKINTEIS